MKKHKTVMLSQDVIAAIEVQAKREGVSFSGLVNKILRDHLEEVLGSKPDPKAAEEE